MKNIDGVEKILHESATIGDKDILEEEGTYYLLDENGEVIKVKTTIGKFISYFFKRDVFNGSTNITYQNYIKNNISILVIGGVLFIYWLTLLLLYEKEDKAAYKQLDDMDLFKKYNPLIAACISQNRNVMTRDIVAVILDLINKEKIHLRLVPKSDSEDIKYDYMISEIKEEKELELDIIERYIYRWFFEEVPDYKNKGIKANYMNLSDEGVLEINLLERIKSISESRDTSSRIKEIKQMAKKKFEKIGANVPSTSVLVKLINNLLIIIGAILVGNHVIQNGLGIVINNFQVLIYMFVAIFAICILPIVYIISLIILKAILSFFTSISEITEKYSGRKLIAKAISVFLSTMILVLIIKCTSLDQYLVYDILLMGVIVLIITTDDYMLKHKPQILVDYFNLKRIEDKLKDSTLMSERNIEHIELWNHYYTYSIALGIPIETGKETNIIEINYENVILSLKDLECIYYVCRSYLEVFWNADFETTDEVVKIIKDLTK